MGEGQAVTADDEASNGGTNRGGPVEGPACESVPEMRGGSFMSAAPTYTAAQVRDAEVPLLEAGVPLMLRAAHALAQTAIAELETIEADSDQPCVLVLAGSGNNGGDALFAAAEIAETGARVDLLPVAPRWHREGMNAALAAGAGRIAPEQALSHGYDLIIDGILGTGTSASPALRGGAHEIVRKITETMGERTAKSSPGSTQDPRIIAVDIPSGLHPDTGQVTWPMLRADRTVTFGGVKHGLTVQDGPAMAGQITLVRIGLEENLAKVRPAGVAQGVQIIDLTD